MIYPEVHTISEKWLLHVRVFLNEASPPPLLLLSDQLVGLVSALGQCVTVTHSGSLFLGKYILAPLGCFGDFHELSNSFCVNKEVVFHNAMGNHNLIWWCTPRSSFLTEGRSKVGYLVDLDVCSLLPTVPYPTALCGCSFLSHYSEQCLNLCVTIRMPLIGSSSSNVFCLH